MMIFVTLDKYTFDTDCSAINVRPVESSTTCTNFFNIPSNTN